MQDLYHQRYVIVYRPSSSYRKDENDITSHTHAACDFQRAFDNSNNITNDNDNMLKS